MRILLVCLLACGSPERTPATPVEIVMPDAAIAIDAAPPAPAPIDATDPVLARRLDAVLDHAIAGPIVGAAVIVARDGVIVYAREAGMADREARIAVTDRTQFRIASMTKAIVTVAALALIDQKVLALDDPVTRWLPDFRPKLANGRQPVITVRHLMTHTSGLSYTFLEKPGGTYHQAGISDGIAEPRMDQATNLRRIASVPLKFAPGTRWSYGLSTDVLGAIIAKAGGAPLPEVVARLVTRPLGMQDTVFVPTDRARVAWPYGAGKPPARMTEPYDLVGSGIIFSPER
ncbi:MAG: serine hydrolase domain-containing protein, partial [Kofleriaceae bacterium]